MEKSRSVTSPGVSSYVVHCPCVAVLKSLPSIVVLSAESLTPDAPKSSSRSSACLGGGSAFRFIAPASSIEAPKPPMVWWHSSGISVSDPVAGQVP